MKVTITDSSAVVRNYTSYYDRSQAAFTYNETLDSQSGRTKTGEIILFKVDASFVMPVEDQIIKIYRDVAGTDLIFGGVISKVIPKVIARTSTIWVVQITLQLAGYDPKTLDYNEITYYDKSAVRSGQVINDLLTAYCPWINLTNVEIAASPLIKRIKLIRRQVSSVIKLLIEKTGWTFFVDDNGNAYFNSIPNLALNWGLTEGTAPNYFPEFDFGSLAPESNIENTVNDVTVIGGLSRGSKVVEVLRYNGQTGSKALLSLPYGLDKNIQFFDDHADNSIDITKWYENDAGNKVAESSGRLQILSAVNNTCILVAKQLFSREDNCELRYAELQITNAAAGSLVDIGVHNAVQSTSVNNFIHAFEFENATLRYREGASVTGIALTVGAGIYSLRIRIKSSGGAIYYIQGGRSLTPKEYGELGSKTWTKAAETSSDTTAFLGVATYASGVSGATVIRSKVSKEIDVKVELIGGSNLGSAAPVVVDTILMCGIEGSQDYETDCFIKTGDSASPTIEFYTDNLPLGLVRVTYNQTDTMLRERVTNAAGKTAVDARSALTGDDGTRKLTLAKQDFIVDSQDARDIAIALLNKAGTLHYRGKFVTSYYKLSVLIPAGDKPIAGKRISITLPNTYGITTTEVITSVVASDAGAEGIIYEITFGEAITEFDRLLLALQSKTIEIVDDEEAAIPPLSEDLATAATARVLAPEFSTGSFDVSGVAISWAAASGASTYEVRDNLFRGQGQGGTLVYQNSGATSYSISNADIKNIHKKRSFTLYVWSVSAGGVYSKYPLIVTVEDTAPLPQPIKDLVVPNGLLVQVRFNTEVESDILAFGRTIQIATDRAMASLVVNSSISKTVENYDYTGAANTVYYIRFGLSDDYTNILGDMKFSGIREIKTGAADFSGTLQYINNVAPDNPTTALAMTSAVNPSGDCIVTFTFNYTQGSNIATAFALVFDLANGTPDINDPSFMVPARTGTGLTYKVQLPNGTLASFAVIPVAVTKGGITQAGSYQTITSHRIGASSTITYIDAVDQSGGFGFVYIGSRSTGFAINTTYNYGLFLNKDYAGTVSCGFTGWSGGITTFGASLGKIQIVAPSNGDLQFATDLYPTGTRNIGSAGLPFNQIYATSLFQGGVNISTVYAAAAHTHTGVYAALGSTNTFAAGILQTFAGDLTLQPTGRLFPRVTTYSFIATGHPTMGAGEVRMVYETDTNRYYWLYYDGANYFSSIF